MAIGSTAVALTRGRLAQAGTIPGAGRRRVVGAMRTVSIAGSARDALFEDWLSNGLLLAGGALGLLRVAWSRSERGAPRSQCTPSRACA